MSKHLGIIICILAISCGTKKETVTPKSQTDPFLWDNASIYFLLTDRFKNGDTANDFVHPAEPAPYRGFMGGDVIGITQKIDDGYFTDLGVNAIWMTPLIENISGSVDEGTGVSYGFHGYWAKDWTAFDKRVGDAQDIATMVKSAHDKGIRVLMDVVVNHTGPVTPSDTKWPDDWVRTGPRCTYSNYSTTTACTLVENLPDILTESTTEVNLPPHLIEKWKAEGRYEQEVAELDAFFARTKYPKRPYYYIVKWLTDMIRDFGIDGYRVDTAKHAEEEVWKILRKEADIAFAEWKKAHPDEVLDDTPFYMVGEVYNYFVGNGPEYDFGDKKVNYFDFGFSALINFDFKGDANKDYPAIFNKYDSLFTSSMKGKSVLNYISSHDDGGPFDKDRKKSIESGTKLLLTQGAAQIYYGDESARSLSVKAQGDATLRSFMNWDEQKSTDNSAILAHWQKLGKFRNNHVSIGAGKNDLISDKPCIFSRTYDANGISDMVICGIGLPIGKKSLPVKSKMKDGDKVLDAYSGIVGEVKDGSVDIDTPFDIVLLEIKK